MTQPLDIAHRYLAAWNETDAKRRRALVDEVFAPDAAYRDPLMAAQGRGEIDAMIAAAQAKFAGLRFALSGKTDTHRDRMRFSWSLGAPNGPAIAEGTDFAVLAPDGRLSDVTGFLDRVPAGAA